MDIPVKCKCGKVSGTANNISPENSSHLVCYCKDCQEFAQYLEKSEAVLDEYGGTEILQMAPAQLDIQEGHEHLKCLRLTRKGLYRWFTDCCNTPIGNTVSARLPFVGVIHSFLDTSNVRRGDLGPIIGHVNCHGATKPLPPKINASAFQPILISKIILKLFKAKLKGLHKPNPFFDETGKAVAKPIIVKE